MPSGPGPTGGTPTPPVATPTPVGATPSPTPKPTPTPIGATPSPKPTPTPIGATPSPKPTPTPIGATPSPTPTTSPSPSQSYATPAPQSVIGSTYGKVGLAQIFDYYPSDGTNIPTATAQADASRYNFVWGSFDTSADPNRVTAWRQGNSSIRTALYYIIEEDNAWVSNNDQSNLAYFQQNHPDWILYACNSSGQMTSDYAYTQGDGFPDVPLNLENSAVRAYQYNSLITYAQQHGYTTVALDEVILYDFMIGNPSIGNPSNQNPNEYACGTRNSDGSANIIYSSKNDSKWAQDIVTWVQGAYQAAHQAGLSVAINHPAGSTGSLTEQQLIQNTDILLNEAGFTNYGTSNHYPLTDSSMYTASYAYMEYAQARGKAVVDIDRWDIDGNYPTANHIEYGIATYELTNEGNLDLFQIAKVGPYGYGAENYHNEYAQANQLGYPCTAAQSGGQSIYYRRFSNGLVVANVGAPSAENYTLPSNHTYTDLEGRSLSNTLSINPEDGYVLFTNGNGCQ